MPGPQSGGVASMWGSFAYGGVHFVITNSETDWPGAEEENTGDGHFPWLPAGHFAPNGTYMAWLAADLAAAAADPTVHYIVAVGHRPFEDLPEAQAAALVALFKASQVDLYLCGHGHTYIRYDVAAFGDGAVHIMPGASGSDETPYPADQLAPLPVGGAAAPGAQARCLAWCAGAEARSTAAASAASALLAQLPLPLGRMLPDAAALGHKACHLCGGRSSKLAPVAATDKYSLGKVDVGEGGLTFTLLRAPDGEVLDSVVIPRKQRNEAGGR